MMSAMSAWPDGRIRVAGSQARYKSWCAGAGGAKPAAVCRWIFELLGAAPGDTLDDLFPGSGAVGRAWTAFTRLPEPALWE